MITFNDSKSQRTDSTFIGNNYLKDEKKITIFFLTES
jgi:hypothetical protein